MINTGLLLFCVTLLAAAIPTIAKLGTYGFRKPLVGRNSRTIRIASICFRADTENSTLWMRIIVTLTVLLCALYTIFSKHYEADQQKWAFGVIGTVLGYWLKG